MSINGHEAGRNIKHIKKGGSSLIEQTHDPEELSIEGLKRVGEPKANLPECAETHPIDTRIWKFAISIADTISIKLGSGLEFGKFIGPYKTLNFN
jgi:hypothetical protein